MSTQIPSVTSTPASTAASQTGTTPVLGEDDFLKLLTMQMQYQDPMNPMSGTEFASQLAQFSSVEQLTNINSELAQSISANTVLTQSINNDLAATFIGKDVRATTNSFQYTGTGDVKLGYTLPTDADTASVTISDAYGNVVRTIKGAPTGSGDDTFSWDGKDDAGNVVAAGKYTFSVQAAGSDGGAITASPFVYGTVSGIRFKSDGTVFVVDGVEVPLSDILEITEQ
ncbi:MAG TPA: flagellar hook capping FlgD N-terminal domain-containing protein [Bacteroidota bacterium]|nr:flagellar hook capping FlgD N-terminal domain-containing protein [Bacteroidota bacterium]